MPLQLSEAMRHLPYSRVRLFFFSAFLLTLFVPPANTRYLRSVSRQHTVTTPTSSANLDVSPSLFPSVSISLISPSPILQPSLSPDPSISKLSDITDGPSPSIRNESPAFMGNLNLTLDGIFSFPSPSTTSATGKTVEPSVLGSPSTSVNTKSPKQSSKISQSVKPKITLEKKPNATRAASPSAKSIDVADVPPSASQEQSSIVSTNPVPSEIPSLRPASTPRQSGNETEAPSSSLLPSSDANPIAKPAASDPKKSVKPSLSAATVAKKPKGPSVTPSPSSEEQEVLFVSPSVPLAEMETMLPVVSPTGEKPKDPAALVSTTAKRSKSPSATPSTMVRKSQKAPLSAAGDPLEEKPGFPSPSSISMGSIEPQTSVTPNISSSGELLLPDSPSVTKTETPSIVASSNAGRPKGSTPSTSTFFENPSTQPRISPSPSADAIIATSSTASPVAEDITGPSPMYSEEPIVTEQPSLIASTITSSSTGVASSNAVLPSPSAVESEKPIASSVATKSPSQSASNVLFLPGASSSELPLTIIPSPSSSVSPLSSQPAASSVPDEESLPAKPHTSFEDIPLPPIDAIPDLKASPSMSSNSSGSVVASISPSQNVSFSLGTSDSPLAMPDASTSPSISFIFSATPDVNLPFPEPSQDNIFPSASLFVGSDELANSPAEEVMTATKTPIPSESSGGLRQASESPIIELVFSPLSSDKPDAISPPTESASLSELQASPATAPASVPTVEESFSPQPFDVIETEVSPVIDGSASPGENQSPGTRPAIAEGEPSLDENGFAIVDSSPSGSMSPVAGTSFPEVTTTGAVSSSDFSPVPVVATVSEEAVFPVDETPSAVIESPSLEGSQATSPISSPVSSPAMPMESVSAEVVPSASSNVSAEIEVPSPVESAVASAVPALERTPSPVNEDSRPEQSTLADFTPSQELSTSFGEKDPTLEGSLGPGVLPTSDLVASPVQEAPLPEESPSPFQNIPSVTATPSAPVFLSPDFTPSPTDDVLLPDDSSSASVTTSLDLSPSPIEELSSPGGSLAPSPSVSPFSVEEALSLEPSATAFTEFSTELTPSPFQEVSSPENIPAESMVPVPKLSSSPVKDFPDESLSSVVATSPDFDPPITTEIPAVATVSTDALISNDSNTPSASDVPSPEGIPLASLPPSSNMDILPGESPQESTSIEMSPSSYLGPVAGDEGQPTQEVIPSPTVEIVPTEVVSSPDLPASSAVVESPVDNVPSPDVDTSSNVEPAADASISFAAESQPAQALSTPIATLSPPKGSTSPFAEIPSELETPLPSWEPPRMLTPTPLGDSTQGIASPTHILNPNATDEQGTPTDEQGTPTEDISMSLIPLPSPSSSLEVSSASAEVLESYSPSPSRREEIPVPEEVFSASIDPSLDLMPSQSVTFVSTETTAEANITPSPDDEVPGTSAFPVTNLTFSPLSDSESFVVSPSQIAEGESTGDSPSMTVLPTADPSRSPSLIAESEVPQEESPLPDEGESPEDPVVSSSPIEEAPSPAKQPSFSILPSSPFGSNPLPLTGTPSFAASTSEALVSSIGGMSSPAVAPFEPLYSEEASVSFPEESQIVSAEPENDNSSVSEAFVSPQVIPSLADMPSPSLNPSLFATAFPASSELGDVTSGQNSPVPEVSLAEITPPSLLESAAPVETRPLVAESFGESIPSTEENGSPETVSSPSESSSPVWAAPTEGTVTLTPDASKEISPEIESPPPKRTPSDNNGLSSEGIAVVIDSSTSAEETSSPEPNLAFAGGSELSSPELEEPFSPAPSQTISPPFVQPPPSKSSENVEPSTVGAEEAVTGGDLFLEASSSPDVLSIGASQSPWSVASAIPSSILASPIMEPGLNVTPDDFGTSGADVTPLALLSTEVSSSASGKNVGPAVSQPGNGVALPSESLNPSSSIPVFLTPTPPLNSPNVTMIPGISLSSEAVQSVEGSEESETSEALGEESSFEAMPEDVDGSTVTVAEADSSEEPLSGSLASPDVISELPIPTPLSVGGIGLEASGSSPEAPGLGSTVNPEASIIFAEPSVVPVDPGVESVPASSGSPSTGTISGGGNGIVPSSVPSASAQGDALPFLPGTGPEQKEGDSPPNPTQGILEAIFSPNILQNPIVQSSTEPVGNISIDMTPSPVEEITGDISASGGASGVRPEPSSGLISPSQLVEFIPGTATSTGEVSPASNVPERLETDSVEPSIDNSSQMPPGSPPNPTQGILEAIFSPNVLENPIVESSMEPVDNISIDMTPSPVEEITGDISASGGANGVRPEPSIGLISPSQLVEFIPGTATVTGEVSPASNVPERLETDSVEPSIDNSSQMPPTEEKPESSVDLEEPLFDSAISADISLEPSAIASGIEGGASPAMATPSDEMDILFESPPFSIGSPLSNRSPEPGELEEPQASTGSEDDMAMSSSNISPTPGDTVEASGEVDNPEVAGSPEALPPDTPSSMEGETPEPSMPVSLDSPEFLEPEPLLPFSPSASAEAGDPEISMPMAMATSPADMSPEGSSDGMESAEASSVVSESEGASLSSEEPVIAPSVEEIYPSPSSEVNPVGSGGEVLISPPSLVVSSSSPEADIETTPTSESGDGALESPSIDVTPSVEATEFVETSESSLPSTPVSVKPSVDAVPTQIASASPMVTPTPSVTASTSMNVTQRPVVFGNSARTPSPGVDPLANPEIPHSDGPISDVMSTNGLPGGVGGVSGMAVGSFLMILVVASVLYKTCAVFPGGGGFAISSIFGSSDDGEDKNGRMGDIGGGGIGADSPWDQVWRSASELPEVVVAAGEAAAALIGGQFAGLFKPGAARVRPPQVITRLAVPGMCMALSQLSPSVGSDVFSNMSGHSSDSRSFHSSRFPSSHQNLSGSGGGNKGDEGNEAHGLAASIGPKVDLLFVFDASGSLSWRDYRSMKEILTKPGGLIDNVVKMVGNGSRIGFIEYAYDSVVVSELDRDEEAVRRRILSSFQGDANNWDRDGMYIYEVGEDVGGNALRKVNSLVGREGKGNETAGSESIQESEGDIEEPPTVQAKEVPPAMNGMCREAHLALKWSRFEMLPPVANKRIQEQLQNALRLRRVVVVNAGDLTEGGQPDTDIEETLKQKKEMEKLGIRILTLGIGESQDKNLSKLASGKSHFSTSSVEGVEGLIPKVAEMILKMDPKHDGKLSRNPPAILKRKKKKRDRSAREKRQHAVYRAVQSGAIDPAKSISKGLPRRASELPPWFTQ